MEVQAAQSLSAMEFYSKGMVTRHEIPKVQIMLELKWSRGMMFGWSREAKVKTTATQKLNSDLFWDDKSVISVMTLSFRPSRALRASRARALRAHTRGPAHTVNHSPPQVGPWPDVGRKRLNPAMPVVRACVCAGGRAWVCVCES